MSPLNDRGDEMSFDSSHEALCEFLALSSLDGVTVIVER